ncbi:unnamed protein product (macronuclear) [Paramecium tetraurelia]|uniref:Uncharacterized protein n=1 Tax=Paramecium tetraurelia TaxID=5888 RepID=A0CIU8_PARTE|nr:uncharacterized protein GSPATT00007850001 [Paramecium tetraurelia]CAK70715.1 unnamed protein product [Paramecium tetraurelia]|eukprot:XP_001438112.1 hypothetical protein (macronuclear) [Paramecium tetraurelia strain d4-2]
MNNQSSKSVRFNEGHKILQPVNTNTTSTGSSKLTKVTSAIQELRTSFNNQAQKLTSSRVSDQLNESVATVTRSPGHSCAPSYCQPCQPMCQPMCQSVCQPQFGFQQQQMCSPQAYVVQGGSDQRHLEKEIKKLKKKNKKLKESKEEVIVSTIAETPKRQRPQQHVQDPEIDTIKREIQEMERIIKQMEQQPKQQSNSEIELYLEDNKKCLKKMCKKIKSLEKELYEVGRQRDEALIIKQQLERENQEMFDRIGELESLLKVADKKVFDLTVQLERQNGYVKQLEDEVERLRKKKKKKQIEIQERVVEKIVEKPVEVIKTVHVNQPHQVQEVKPVEIIKEVIKEVPSEPKIVEKIIEIPKIEYVYQQVPQYIEVPKLQTIEVPVVQRIEVPYEVPYYRDVPYEVIKEVPYEVVREVIKEVPYEVIKEVIKEVPYEVIKEIPVYIEVPVDRIVERRVEVPVERIVEVPVDRVVEVPVPYEVPYPYERVVEVPYERIVEVPRDRYMDRYIDRPVDRYVEVPVERRVEVPYERIVEVPYEKIVEVPVEKIVEVPVEKIVEVPVDRFVERYVRDDAELEMLNIENRELQRIIGIWEDRANKLENEIIKERRISDKLRFDIEELEYMVEDGRSFNNQQQEQFRRYLKELKSKYESKIIEARKGVVIKHHVIPTEVQQTVIQQPISTGISQNLPQFGGQMLNQ